MNPWMAHLENQDLDWMIQQGRRLYADPGSVLVLDQPMLILEGTVALGDVHRGPGALLGVAEWFFGTALQTRWQVLDALWALVLPLNTHHREDWAVALAVALSAETRGSVAGNALADGEAAGLKFRYVLNRLDLAR